MVLKHYENGHKGTFYLEEGAELIAEIKYSFAGADKMILDRTIIYNKLVDQNELTKLLLDTLIDYSRKKNIRVIPLCNITKSLIDQDMSYQDVLIK